MKKIKILLSAAVIGLSITSCNDYLDVNENPNALPIENVTPDLILPGVVTQMYRVRSGSELQLGSLFMNNWAGDTYIYGGPFSGEFTLSAVNSLFYNDIWDNTYKNLYNLNVIEKYSNEDHKQDNFVAIAKILKAFYMQRVVDLYGDAPYSEAWLGNANSTPKYDNDQDVYKALIAELDLAMNMITMPNSNAVPVGSADIIFGGTMANWKLFANTIKLKYLVRMSNITSGEMATYRDQKLAEVATVGFITTDVFEKPGYTTGNNDSLNPLYFNYFATAAGTFVSNYNLITVSEHMANTLEGNSILSDSNYSKFTGLNDPRKNRMFTNISGSKGGIPYAKLKGVRQGATAGSPGAIIDPTDPSARKTSKFAQGMFFGNVTTGSTTVAGLSNLRGGTLITAAEINFLQSEAALRWPSIFSGIDAQAKFNTGVSASITYTGAAAGTYLASITARPGLGFTGSNAQKLEAIITQKWLALTNVDAMESFIEYNRTGFPYTPLAVTAVTANKPYRLQYPQSELAANPNTPNVPTSSLFTKNNQYTPFWNQN